MGVLDLAILPTFPLLFVLVLSAAVAAFFLGSLLLTGTGLGTGNTFVDPAVEFALVDFTLDEVP